MIVCRHINNPHTLLQADPRILLTHCATAAHYHDALARAADVDSTPIRSNDMIIELGDVTVETRGFFGSGLDQSKYQA